MMPLLLGLLSAPATSGAYSLFHDPNDNPAPPNETFPLRVPEGSSVDVNLWLDDDGSTVFGVHMVINASGSLTFELECPEPCTTNPEDTTGAITGVNLFRGDDEGGDVTPLKIGTFVIHANGAVGDDVMLDSGEFLNSSWETVKLDPLVLAVIVPCGDATCSGGCGDVNEDGVFDPNDPAALRLHLADPSAGVLTPDGLAWCAVISSPSGCSILQAVVMRRALQDPPLAPGLAPVCDCCIAHGSPGCSDPFTESCVCDSDASCCTTAWDGACVSRADSDCGTCSATPPGP
jgi:hypothetical protein